MVKRSRSIDLTQVSEWQEGELRRFHDYLVAEEPLEIRVGGAPLTVTMRTPGHDLELAAGFLFTEGLIQRREQIASLEAGPAKQEPAKEPAAAGNRVHVELSGAEFEPERMRRNFFAASSCGICGKSSIDAIRVRGILPPNPEFRLHPEILCSLPDKLRAAQTIFGRTGGLHAAGLFSADGELIVVREDVGRHNAVDKVVGWALLEARLPLSQCVLMVSGRGGFEIIQKALVAGIPLVASVSAPSGLAVRLARQLGLTLVGFLRARRFLIYSREERLAPAPAAVEVGVSRNTQ
ncbi:MAG TPA: formate dehydrogenase accessory sulfurtransferase FdhD [Candidatus Sulfotelmatobacter sp.]|nr:formate dehydrogenase accessory sulfurtransferase FdhD [Candidatus Sulfotelmatobacter sp.]